MGFNNFIGGTWVNGSAEKTNINPSNLDDVIGAYACADADDVQQAIDAACSSLKSWNRVTLQDRCDILDRIGSEILTRREELGRLLSREEGKTLPEGVGEVTRAGMVFKFFAGEVLRLGGERLPSVRPGVDIEVVREPVGVVGVISPWNFPIAIPAWKIAPALAYGNCQARQSRSRIGLGIKRNHFPCRPPRRCFQSGYGVGRSGGGDAGQVPESGCHNLHRIQRGRQIACA
jgi:aldehyde dehydrogenase (NAD+)